MKTSDPQICSENASATYDEESDFLYALQLQTQLNEENFIDKKFHDENVVDVTQQDEKIFVNDATLELLDPCPDIHQLFTEYDAMFFSNKLNSVEVKWSKRMKLCAGTCQFHNRAGFCCITLSEPLLKFRSRKEIIETLLHEMIHAYLFVTRNNKDRSGHGPEFLKHMKRINDKTNLNITVYHNFKDEVELYRQHWWRCKGPCRYRAPYYGFVKRSSNRAPGPYDYWWERHRSSCGGEFIKVKEPDKSAATNRKKSGSVPSRENNNFLDKFVNHHTNTKDGSLKTSKNLKNVEENDYGINSSMKNVHVLTKNRKQINGDEIRRDLREEERENDRNYSRKISGSLAASQPVVGFGIKRISNNVFTFEHNHSSKHLRSFDSNKIAEPPSRTVQCPSCLKPMDIDLINDHLDQCLTK